MINYDLCQYLLWGGPEKKYSRQNSIIFSLGDDVKVTEKSVDEDIRRHIHSNHRTSNFWFCFGFFFVCTRNLPHQGAEARSTELFENELS